MITEEQLPELLPCVIQWVERIASEAQGRPLDAQESELAEKTGVKEPARVRVVPCEQLPLPDDPVILDVCGGPACFEIAAALTVGHTIWIRCEKDPPRVPGLFLNPDGSRMSFSEAISLVEFQDRAAAVNSARFRSALSHELRHVHHFEQAGSIAAFTEATWRETLRSGYENNRFEVDARRYELPLWRSAAEMAALAAEEL